MLFMVDNALIESGFGFSKGSDFDLTNEYGADAAFMAIELHPDALVNVSGLVKYTQAFADCDA